MLIPLEKFQGIRPLISPDLIGLNEAQTAHNCNLKNGQIRPWKNYIKVEELVNDGTIRTIYLYLGQYWFEFEADVDIISAPIAHDTADKVYFTGYGIPKKTNKTEATTGEGAMPINYFPMAVPTPLVALTATVSPPPAGSGDDRDIVYRWTVVTDWGEESYPSPPSSLVTAKSGEKVDLTGMSVEWQSGTAYALANSVFEASDEGGDYLYKCIVAGTSGISEPTWVQEVGETTEDGTVTWQCFKNNLGTKRIYRLNMGDQYADYQYVGAIGVDTTTYSDTISDANLGSPCPSLSQENGGAAVEDWDPAPDGLQGICFMSNGIALGFVGKDLYVSEAYRLWAWPAGYMLSCLDNIVAIVPSSDGTSAIVTTDGHPYVLTGVSPSSLTLSRLPETKPNISKRSAATYKNGAVYASSDGLRYIDQSSNINLTSHHFSTRDWAEFRPSTMTAAIHDGMYFGFYSSGGTEGCLVIDLETGVISTIDLYSPATYVDPETDTLYFVMTEEGVEEAPDVNFVYAWEGDQTQPFPANLNWKSRRFLLPARVTFNSARVIAETDDRQTYYEKLEARDAQIMRNNARISAGMFGGSIGEDAIGEDLEINGDNLEPVDTVGEYSGDFNLSVKFYGDEVLKFTKEIYANDVPFRLPGGFRARTWEIQVEGNVPVRRVDMAASMKELTARGE